MTVSSEVSRAGPYTGNGVTVSFAFGFRILDETHIRVVRTEGGVDTDVTTGFTVSGVGSPSGGTITFSVAPTSAQTITIVRDVPQTQEIDLVNQGAYFAEVVEEGFDLAAMRDQQLQEQLDRTVKVPVGSNVSNIETLIANVTALAGIAEDISDLAGVTAAIAVLANAVSAVAIAAANVADITNFSDVYLGPRPTNPTTRTNGSPLVAGDLFFDTSENRLKNWTGSAWVLSASSVNGIRSTQAYLATAGQTVFAATYDVGFVDVFLNGVRLRPTVDFTATNGTSITLLAPAALNDEIDIISFGAFSLANMLEKSQNFADVPDKGAARVILDVPQRGQIVASDVLASAKRLAGSGGSSVTDDQLATAAWTREAVFGYLGVNPLTGGGTIFPARSVVNFHGIPTNGTYSRSGTVTTVTMAGHGMSVGALVNLDFTSGAATDGNYLVLSVIDANTFTVNEGGSGATSGNVTRNTWARMGRNIRSVTRNGAGDYTIEFFAALANADYAVSLSVGTTVLGNTSQTANIHGSTTGPTLKTSTQLRIHVGSSANGIPNDNAEINVVAFQ